VQLPAGAVTMRKMGSYAPVRRFGRRFPFPDRRCSGGPSWSSGFVAVDVVPCVEAVDEVLPRRERLRVRASELPGPPYADTRSERYVLVLSLGSPQACAACAEDHQDYRAPGCWLNAPTTATLICFIVALYAIYAIAMSSAVAVDDFWQSIGYDISSAANVHARHVRKRD